MNRHGSNEEWSLPINFVALVRRIEYPGPGRGGNIDIYLDANATTLLRPALRDELIRLTSMRLGNPASPHSWGDRSGRVLAEARSRVADFFGVEDSHFIFTSGGSESNTMVLRSFAWANGKNAKFVTSAVEHQSVLATVNRLGTEGHEVHVLPVDSNGLVDPDQLSAALSSENPTLVSIQWVNNETGVVQDLARLTEVAHAFGAKLHTDAAQAVGKQAIDFEIAPVDFLTFTGHKVHAPAGVGAVYARSVRDLVPLIGGGEQEGGLRPGTPPLFSIALLGLALEDRQRNWSEHLRQLETMRDAFEGRVLTRGVGVTVNGTPRRRAPNTTSLRFAGLDGRALVAQLDQAGVICSQASACTSSIPEPSHVLRAMGLNEEEAWGSVRFSFSIDNTLQDADRAGEIVAKVSKRVAATAALLEL